MSKRWRRSAGLGLGMPRKPQYTQEDFDDKTYIKYFKKGIAIEKYAIAKKQRRIKTLEKYIAEAKQKKDLKL